MQHVMHPFIVFCLVLFPGTSIFQVSLTGASLLLLTVEAAPPHSLCLFSPPCCFHILLAVLKSHFLSLSLFRRLHSRCFLEASRCQPSWKLLAVLICRSCHFVIVQLLAAFSWPFLLFCSWLLVGRSYRFFFCQPFSCCIGLFFSCFIFHSCCSLSSCTES